MGVSENVVYPIVPNGFADHEIPMKNCYFIGNININPTFSDKPNGVHKPTYTTAREHLVPSQGLWGYGFGGVQVHYLQIRHMYHLPPWLCLLGFARRSRGAAGRSWRALRLLRGELPEHRGRRLVERCSWDVLIFLIGFNGI